MDKITHEVRLAQWAEVVKQCQARPEGMSANTWLKENGIAVKNYYYWQRRVRNEVYNQVTSLAPAQNTHNGISFAEVPGEILNATNEPTDNHQGFLSPDAIIKTGHMEIQIHNSLSPMLLKSIMEVAARAC